MMGRSKPKPMHFAWKDAVRRSNRLSRAAKQTAISIVDEYIYQPRGTCFASNETLSKLIGIDVRTVQRHVRELERKGYIRRHAEPGRRRVISLNYDVIGKGDTATRVSMTKLAREHDKNITCNKKNKRNNNGPVPDLALKSVILREEDASCLKEWRMWVEANTPHCWTELLDRLVLGQGYSFPSRYPQSPSEEEAEKRAHEFFDAYMRRR